MMQSGEGSADKVYAVEMSTILNAQQITLLYNVAIKRTFEQFHDIASYYVYFCGVLNNCLFHMTDEFAFSRIKVPPEVKFELKIGL